MFGWNYPPGVSGNEFPIAGPDYERDLHAPCPSCSETGTLYEQGYKTESWITCYACGYTEDLPELSRADWNPDL